MQLGNLFINPREVLCFSVDRVTSVDIRISIEFKNSSREWTRDVDEVQIQKLKELMLK